MAIEKKMNKGERMDFPPTTADSGPYSIGDSRKFTKRESNQFLEQKSGSRIRNVTPAHVDKTNRNYIWLRYKIGEVSNMLTGGLDVLSGKFSGCYMIKFKLPGEGWRVGHVDTGEKGGAAGVTAWNKLVTDHNPEIACGFKPFQAQFTGDFATTTATYGIILADGHKCYSVVAENSTMWNSQKGEDTNIRRILKVTERDTIPVNDLRVLTLMND